MSTRISAALLLVAAVGVAAPGLAQPPAAPPTPQATPAAAPARAQEIATADDLLRALETADASLATLETGIRYLREFGAIEGDERQQWEGTLYFDADLRRPPVPAAQTPGPQGQSALPPRRGFAVVFDNSIVNNQLRAERRAYIFDGEWFVEKNLDERQMVRRRVVPPGEVADPLRIGEGPFPIPIGQRRDDILRRFAAELRPPGDGFADGVGPPMIRDAYQLRLVPREGTPEAREFREVRLWYRGGDLLPRLARTVNVDGGTSEVILINHKVNETIPGGVFDTSPPPREAGWDVQTEEWRGVDDNRR